MKVGAGSGYAIQVSGPLDRESRDTWHVWLEARDGGSPSRVAHRNITIRVVDVNDCAPVFEEAMYRCEFFSVIIGAVIIVATNILGLAYFTMFLRPLYRMMNLLN